MALIFGFLAGFYATGVGFGFLPAPGKDHMAQQNWINRHGKQFRILGPIIITFTITLFLIRFFGFK
jgi:hypothetical protein